MEYQKIVMLAAKGEPMPKEGLLPDFLAYASLKSLKYEYEVMGLEMEKVRLQKQKIKALHGQYMEAYQGYLAGMKEYQGNIQKAGALRTQIMKEPDQARKLQLALECIGVMTDDRNFVRYAG